MRPRVTSIGLILPPRPQADFVYPRHIDAASIDALPAKPGVYFFRDRTGQPIYIGKSVNIRSRVLAHLRTAEETAMLAATRRIDFMRTAGETGALLLEAQLIKLHQPAFNVLLKFRGEAYALHLPGVDSGPRVAAYGELNDDNAAQLHGLFVSRSAAQEGLQALIRRHQLCPALLGLESRSHKRACFAHQIGHCLGACVGHESHDTHYHRLRQALAQLHAAVWPYGDAPIGIVETDGQWRQIHIVHRWSYIGSLQGRKRKLPLPAAQGIDIDTYKILARPLAEGSLVLGKCEIRGRQIYYVDDSAGSVSACPLAPKTSMQRL